MAHRPSKKAKGKEVGSSDGPKTMEVEVKDQVMSRSLIFEKYFPPHPSLRFYATLEHYGFGKLIGKRKKGHIPIVREYCYQAAITNSLTCKVRGQQVQISKETIQSFFQLRTVNNCSYKHYMDNLEQIPYQAIANLLAASRERAKWHVTDGVHQYIKRQNLNKEARFWLHFVASNLLLVSHTSDVTMDRALMIYLFLLDKPVDVAQIIWDYLRTAVTEHTLAMGFPHLIYDLCLAAGVKKKIGDQPFPRKFAFKYNSIKVVEEGEAPNNEDEIMQDAEMEEQQQQQRATTRGFDPRVDILITEIAKVNKKLDRLMLNFDMPLEDDEHTADDEDDVEPDA